MFIRNVSDTMQLDYCNTVNETTESCLAKREHNTVL